METKTKLFKCDRCEQNVSAVWRVRVGDIEPFDLCDECYEDLKKDIVEFVK